ncbi:hypothetical protein T492DRAFT_861589, partial [Pavlovales sp. CCMP2436]
AALAACAHTGMLDLSHAHALRAHGAGASELAVSCTDFVRDVARTEAFRKASGTSRRFYHYLKRFDLAPSELRRVVPYSFMA